MFNSSICRLRRRCRDASRTRGPSVVKMKIPFNKRASPSAFIPFKPGDLNTSHSLQCRSVQSLRMNPTDVSKTPFRNSICVSDLSFATTVCVCVLTPVKVHTSITEAKKETLGHRSEDSISNKNTTNNYNTDRHKHNQDTISSKVSSPVFSFRSPPAA